MTIDKLQQDMIVALKNGDKIRKSTISMMISQIKRTAIDKGIKDTIPEELINAEILRYKKMMEETVRSYHVLTPQWEQACAELSIVAEYAPQLIDSTYDICQILMNEYTGPQTKKDMMKFLSSSYKNKMDMKTASKAVDMLLREEK